MVESGAPEGGLIIRRQTFIVKNTHTIDEVYERETKVSSDLDCTFHPDTGHLYFLHPSNSAKVPTARSVLASIALMDNAEPSSASLALKSRIGTVF